MLDALIWMIVLVLAVGAVLIVPVRELRYSQRLRTQHDVRMRKLFESPPAASTGRHTSG